MAFPNDLTALLSPDQVSTQKADLELAAHDESACPPSLPDIVTWPLTTVEVSRVVRYAYEKNIALTARGAGSSLEGGQADLRSWRVAAYFALIGLIPLAGRMIWPFPMI